MNSAERKMTERLMFRLLPIQVLLSAIGAVNGIVTSLFASNYVGSEAMSAVGLYGPIGNFIGAISTVLVTGASILCGQYLGKDLKEKLQNVFTLDILISVLFSALLILFHIGVVLFSNGFLTSDASLWPIFRAVLLGQTVGILPTVLGNQLASFLSLENKTGRTTVASLAFILANLLFNWLFLSVFHLEALGLALASSLGMWVFFSVEASAFFGKGSLLKLNLKELKWKESLGILKIGIPGGISYIYLSVRGIIVNALILKYVGNDGLAAFSASNSFLGFFWAIPGGMMAVSRMLFAVNIGEEDRQSLLDTMNTAMYRYLPLQCLISLLIILLAVPFTHLYYHDISAAVFSYTVIGFRILPLCMPLSLICMHFSGYWQSSGRTLPVHILSAFDGLLSVAFFTWILMPHLHMNAAYLANVLNGVVTSIIILAYSAVSHKRLPKNMEELMVIPEDFGVRAEERMDISITTMEEVVQVSEAVDDFLKAHGLSNRRASLAGLFLEEMAGNVVLHGFTKDKKKHSADIRVALKQDDVILRIKDDCIPFDPSERLSLIDPEDPVKNLGIRMVYQSAKSVTYRNLLGLNVLTIKI